MPNSAILGSTPAFPEKLKLFHPTFPSNAELAPYLDRIRESGWISNFGPLSQRFEAEIAERLDAKHCIALGNLSTGLMYMPIAAGLSKGEVILPSFTFMATVHSLKLGGLTPVFADIHPEMLTLDPVSVEKAITPETVAVCGVHIYGNPCDIEGLQDVCDRHGLVLFFDSAHGLGSSYKGKPIGGFGLAEGFSTSVTKVMTTFGEGGFICTNNSQFAERLRLARNWGHTGNYDPVFPSICSKMPEINAAAGLIELTRLDQILINRRRSVEKMTKRLTRLPGLRVPLIQPSNISGYKDFTVRINADDFNMNRDQLAASLSAEGIETRKYFFPNVHQTQVYKNTYGTTHVSLENSDKASQEVLCLPLHNSMPDKIINRLCDTIINIQSDAQAIKVNIGE